MGNRGRARKTHLAQSHKTPRKPFQKSTFSPKLPHLCCYLQGMTVAGEADPNNQRALERARCGLPKEHRKIYCTFPTINKTRTTPHHQLWPVERNLHCIYKKQIFHFSK